MVLPYFTMTLLMLVGLFLILLILLQRGRGGGLAGAFGGLGGASAFGTKAGDVFTKVTVAVAVVWVALAGINIWILEAGAIGPYEGAGSDLPEVTVPEEDAEESPASVPDSTQPEDTDTEPGAPDEGQDTEPGPAAREDSTAAPDED